MRIENVQPKPEVVAWAPSTALHKLASRHNNAPCILTDTPAEFNDVALVRLSDYEALQAECEKLRKDAERYRYIKKGNQWIIAATQTGFQIDGEDLDDLIDREMEQQK